MGVESWAGKLPQGLYEAFVSAALEATAHVEAETGPVVIEVKLYRREPTQPLAWGVKIVSKEWRGGG